MSTVIGMVLGIMSASCLFFSSFLKYTCTVILSHVSQKDLLYLLRVTRNRVD